MLSFELSTSFTALDTNARPGASGRFVQLVQQQLAALHLFIPQTGVFDKGTELALDAYHRLLGKGEGHTTLDPPTLTDLLDGKGSFHVRFPDQGQHAEGDLSDQVLAFINGSKVHWLFPISSGKPSTPTILGNFQIYYKEPDYLSDGMYFSYFFIGGYAIHGYDPAPDYPASHGCMRLPIVDAIPAFGWLQHRGLGRHLLHVRRAARRRQPRADPRTRRAREQPQRRQRDHALRVRITPRCRCSRPMPPRASGCCACCATRRS